MNNAMDINHWLEAARDLEITLTDERKVLEKLYKDFLKLLIKFSVQLAEFDCAASEIHGSRRTALSVDALRVYGSLAKLKTTIEFLRNQGMLSKSNNKEAFQRIEAQNFVAERNSQVLGGKDL